MKQPRLYASWILQDAQLSQRPRCRVRYSFRQSIEDWNWKTIICKHYRSSFNHCDVIGVKIYRIRWKNAK